MNYIKKQYILCYAIYNVNEQRGFTTLIENKIWDDKETDENENDESNKKNKSKKKQIKNEENIVEVYNKVCRHFGFEYGKSIEKMFFDEIMKG